MYVDAFVVFPLRSQEINSFWQCSSSYIEHQNTQEIILVNEYVIHIDRSLV